MPAAQSKAQQRGLEQTTSFWPPCARSGAAISPVRLPTDLSGIDGELAEAFNDVVNLNDQMSKEFERLGDVVGKQGKINHRAPPAGRGRVAGRTASRR